MKKPTANSTAKKLWRSSPAQRICLKNRAHWKTSQRSRRAGSRAICSRFRPASLKRDRCRARSTGVRHPGGSALPMNAQQVLLGVVMRLEMALIGVADSLADAMRKVNVGGSHQHRAMLVHDFHDALQRMLRLPLCLYDVPEIDDPVMKEVDKVTLDMVETFWKAIVDA